jgi:hypothetical protein
VEFDKFREEVLAENIYDGCLLDKIPNRLLKILSISWNGDKHKDDNLRNIMSLLHGDTEEALNKISERLHIRDGTADLQSLSVQVGVDSAKDPKAQEWSEKAHRALSVTSSKYSTKDINRTIMDGVAENYPSVKRDFTNNYGSSWNSMNSEELIEGITRALATIKRNNEAERFNRPKTAWKRTYDFGNKGDKDFSKDKGASKNATVERLDANDSDKAPSGKDSSSPTKIIEENGGIKSPFKKFYSEQDAKEIKHCKICRTTGDHYWPACSKVDEEKLKFPDQKKIYSDYQEELKKAEASGKKRNVEFQNDTKKKDKKDK